MTLFHALGSQTLKFSQAICYSYADYFYSAATQSIASVCDSRSHFHCFRLAQVQITASLGKQGTLGCREPYWPSSSKGSVACSESHVLRPTQLSKLASFKGSTKISLNSMTTVRHALTEKECFLAYFDATTSSYVRTKQLHGKEFPAVWISRDMPNHSHTIVGSVLWLTPVLLQHDLQWHLGFKISFAGELPWQRAWMEGDEWL